MINKKAEIGKRLTIFAKKFDGITHLAERMGKDRTFFTPYVNGKSYLGGELLSRLAELGCDINWLLTGNESLEVRIKKLEIEVGDLKNELTALKGRNYDLEKLLFLVIDKFGQTIKEKDEALFANLIALVLSQQDGIKEND